ncbi:MAG: ABC transporter permease [Fimbriimonadaceae bacterium]|nr:ABC transporter permease [Fimbriimonadaceae bacterium]
MDSAFGSFVIGVISYATPLTLAALAGMASERSGVVNIGLEGKMLTSACVGALVGLATGNPFAALGAALTAGVLIALLHAWLTQAFQVDHVISGMGINALAIGGTGFLAETAGPLQSPSRVPSLPEPIYWVLALGAAIGASVFLVRTRAGLRLNAVGNDPDKARIMGIDPVTIRWKALIATGLLCGLAGLMIASTAGSFSKEMTAGRGYIALAALILAGWRPIPALAACLAFGLAYSLQILFQNNAVLGVNFPPEFWQALPYLAPVLALALVVQRGRAPAGLGRP